MGERVFGGRLPASRLLFFVEWFGFIEPWVTGFPTGPALMVSGASKTLVSQQLQWPFFFGVFTTTITAAAAAAIAAAAAYISGKRRLALGGWSFISGSGLFQYLLGFCDVGICCVALCSGGAQRLVE
jgi:hypothetical protein